jgi:hypothetical protein
MNQATQKLLFVLVATFSILIAGAALSGCDNGKPGGAPAGTPTPTPLP